jgi:hypothetical protein
MVVVRIVHDHVRVAVCARANKNKRDIDRFIVGRNILEGEGFTPPLQLCYVHCCLSCCLLDKCFVRKCKNVCACRYVYYTHTHTHTHIAALSDAERHAAVEASTN